MQHHLEIHQLMRTRIADSFEGNCDPSGATAIITILHFILPFFMLVLQFVFSHGLWNSTKVKGEYATEWGNCKWRDPQRGMSLSVIQCHGSDKITISGTASNTRTWMPMCGDLVSIVRITNWIIIAIMTMMYNILLYMQRPHTRLISYGRGGERESLCVVCI